MSRRIAVRHMLRKLGQAITVKRTSGGTFDPVTSKTSSQHISIVETKGVTEKYTDTEINGAEIQQNDIKCTVVFEDFADSFTPQPGDVAVLADGTTLNVAKARPMDVDKAFVLQLRA